MSFRKIALGVAAAALAVSPAIGQVVMAPTVAPLDGDENEIGSGTAIVLGVLATAAVIGGIIAASEDSDNEIPISG